MKNSLKQLFRTPGKTAVFFLLSCAAALLLAVSLELWISTDEKIQTVEESFTTLGTVQQKGVDTFPQTEIWSAGIYPVFDLNADYEKLDKTAGYIEEFWPGLEEPETEGISLADLDFPEAEYLFGPEKRPYYGAWIPQAKESQPVTALLSVWEFTPLETAEPGTPFKAEVGRVLAGRGQSSSHEVYICDHYNREPEELEAGKTYIGYLSSSVTFTHKDTQALLSECSLLPYPLSSRPNSAPPYYAEVTDGFYETERGKSWTALAEAIERKRYTFPVLPTGSLKLLPSFHSGKANVQHGREISQEEFDSGAQVCMVSTDFLQKQNLEIGDRISLSLYYADYRFSPRMEYGGDGVLYYSRMNLVNENGEMYPVFWESEYEIVGAYFSAAVYNAPREAIELSDQLLIIPANSVKASDTGSVSETGPMLHTTTSFTIPNGTTEKFLQALKENVPEHSRVEVNFEDGGYAQILANLTKMKTTSILLFFIAAAVALTVLMLMLYFFILKQARRTAIETSLGMTKRQCRISLVSGIMAICIAGTLLGAMGSLALTSASEEYSSRETEPIFSTKYSTWTREGGSLPLTSEHNGSAASALRAVSVALALQGITVFLSILFVNRNLKMDPILFINGKEQGL